MATLTTGLELRRMLNQGVAHIKANPRISQGDFRTWLEDNTNFDRDDWDTGEAVLLELEYVADDNFSTVRVFWGGTTDVQFRVTRNQCEAFYPTSNAARRALFELQRDQAVVQRNAVRDLIQDDLIRFIDAPPAGTPRVIVDELKERRDQRRVERDALNQVIGEIDNILASLP